MPSRRKARGGSGGKRGIRRTAAARGVVRRRRVTPAVRRGASARQAVSRTVRRQKVRQRAAKATARPRPVVRPAIQPRRVMAKAMPRVKRTSPIVRPSSRLQPSARQIKRAVRTGAAVAAAGSFLKLNTARAGADISDQLVSVQSSLDQLQERASMSEVQADITQLDADLNNALSLLENARQKGYKYQKDLDDIAYDAMSRWQSIREDVISQVQKQSTTMQGGLKGVDSAVQNLNNVISSGAASSALSSLQNQINSAMNNIYSAERSIEQAYDDIESKTSQLNSRLTRIMWALTQLDEASFELNSNEDLYMAIGARWDQEGKDDPEGVLYLTNQRLLFEQKEKIATKKILFVTTASEQVQKLLLDYKLSDVKSVKAHNKGLFSHQDFIDVTFPDQTVPFHINGQDSEDWARWIKDAKSGKIKEDRASGSGLKFSDLTGKLTEADIVEIQKDVNELQDVMMLKAVQVELSELENQLNTLARELKELRNRGYVVEKALEADIEVLSIQWEKIKTRTDATMAYQTKVLSQQMSEIQTAMKQLAGKSKNLADARPEYIQLRSTMASALAQAEAAEQTVLQQYDEYADEIESLDAHLEWVDWMLDALETASFKLLATESGVAAVEAIWERTGSDPENGILFLTDQRLLWEDRVDDFELKIEVPVSQIKDSKVKDDEASGSEDLILKFSSAAPMNDACFGLSLPVGEDWLQMIGRACSGGYTEDRAVEIKKEELDRIRNAPNQCSNCGAAFTAPILRGQTEIICEFCGVSTRI